MHQCCRFSVRGRVQGVFFRAATRDKALQLGLHGWVRNLSTGHVELLVNGEQENIEKLEQWLWQGPKFAEVDEVKSEILGDADVDDTKEFYVRGDG